MIELAVYDAILIVILGAVGEMRWRIHRLEKMINGE